MTHNYPLDVNLVEQILPLRPRYLGLLGPKSRAEKLMEQIAQPWSGVDVHAPVGLDLGGDTPESIALSIAGEIQAFLHGRPGGRLKLRNGAIHEPARETGRCSEAPAPLQESVVCDLR